MEKSSQIAWKIAPLRHFFPLKVVPLFPVKGCPAYRSSPVLPVTRGCFSWFYVYQTRSSAQALKYPGSEGARDRLSLGITVD
jgi:hypothetical protein